MSKRFLTLNIGAANIELAEFEGDAKGALTLVNYGVAILDAPLDSGNAETILSPALLSLVREKGFKPGKVAVSISGQMIFARFAAIPMTGGGDHFEQMVRYEIEQNVPFPIDEMVCDRQILGDTEAGDKSVAIVAAKTDQIEAITTALVHSGFTPELVGVAPIALSNAIDFQNAGDDSCRILLDIGARTTSLVIIEGEKVYTRAIPIAGNSVTKEIATVLDLPLEEAEAFKRDRAYVSAGGVTEDADPVVDRAAKACRAVLTRIHAEISRSINFYRSQQHGSAPVKLYLTGGGALLAGTTEFFTESLGIEVTFFNPFEAVAVGPKVDTSALETECACLSAPVGLAYQLLEVARFTINLMPPALLTERGEKAKIPYLIAGGVALLAGLFLVYLSFNTEAEALNERCQAIEGRVSLLNQFDKKVTSAVKALEEESALAETLRQRLVSRSLAVKRLNAVREALQPGMWIDHWDNSGVTIRGWKDRVKGVGGKTAAEVVVDKIKTKNQVVDPDGVKIANMSAVGSNNEIEQFTVEVKFK